MGVSQALRERRPIRRAVQRAMIPLGCAAILAFFLSSGLSHKMVERATSAAVAFVMVLSPLTPTLREISPVLQRWFTLAAGVAAGAAMGLAVRLISG